MFTLLFAVFSLQKIPDKSLVISSNRRLGLQKMSTLRSGGGGNEKEEEEHDAGCDNDAGTGGGRMVLRNHCRSAVKFKAGGNRDNDDGENKVSPLPMPSCDPASFPSSSSSREEEIMELINTGSGMVHCTLFQK